MKRTFAFLLIAGLILSACAPVSAPTSVPATSIPLPTDTPAPTAIPTPVPTATPTATPTPIPTIQVGDLTIPDPRVTNPELFDLTKNDAPIPQFVNAMKMAGIEVTPEQVAQGITYQQLKDKDGNPFVVAVYNLDPDPSKQGETLEGPIPLIVWAEKWGWKKLEKSTAANIAGVEHGTVVEWYRTEKDPRYLEMVKRDFNHISLNTEFHWKYLRPESNQLSNFELTKIDEELEFAETNHMKVDIEGLTWGNRASLPDWLLGESYSQDELGQILENHIAEVLNRYKGRFNRINVVNEPFGNPWESSFWTEKLGLDNYVITAFRAARKADPNAILSIVDINDSDRLFELFKRINEKELSSNGRRLIDAVGWQMPFFLPGSNTNVRDYLDKQRRNVTLEQLRQKIRRYREIGVDVYITESFIDITDFPGSREEKLILQAEIYADIQRLLVEESVSFTMYSFYDDPSIYPQGTGKRTNAYPYPRDENGNPKPSYYSLLREIITSHRSSEMGQNLLALKRLLKPKAAQQTLPSDATPLRFAPQVKRRPLGGMTAEGEQEP